MLNEEKVKLYATLLQFLVEGDALGLRQSLDYEVLVRTIAETVPYPAAPYNQLGGSGTPYVPPSPPYVLPQYNYPNTFPNTFPLTTWISGTAVDTDGETDWAAGKL